MRLRWLIGTQEYVEVYEHRVVDGFVTDAEHVHHDNQVRDDNDPANLVPLSADAHNALHADERRGQRKYGPYRSAEAKAKAERGAARRAERLALQAEIRRLYLDERLTVIEIGERIGLDDSGVSRKLRAAGVKIQPRATRTGGQAKAATAIAKAAAERRARRIVKERAGGNCEACGVPRPYDWAHRVARSHCGPWDPANGAHLCRRCHRWTHAEKTQGRALGWILDSTDDFRTYPFKHWQHGWVLLDSDGGFQYCDPPA